MPQGLANFSIITLALLAPARFLVEARKPHALFERRKHVLDRDVAHFEQHEQVVKQIGSLTFECRIVLAKARNDNLDSFLAELLRATRSATVEELARRHKLVVSTKPVTGAGRGVLDLLLAWTGKSLLRAGMAYMGQHVSHPVRNTVEETPA